jgi:serine/threonine protein kinase/outer membrane protein assembly factor BamB
MLPLSAEDPRMIGEFRLHNRLGAGGMGRVYLGSSPGGRAVAVKVIHPHLARDGAFLGRFRREVAAALAVNGGYAAPVVAAGPDDHPPWLATAYVPGPSLQEVVTASGPLPEDAVLKLAAGLAEALRVIHSCGLVHRDLKPGNVLLAADGPRVIDFGIARALDGTVLTSAESLLGTPSYMSPEQAQSQPAGPPSDVFSLGGVLYFAATGSNPFGTGHPAVMLYRIVHTEPDLDQVPPGLRDLIAACLARDPAQRPAPAELAAALMGAVPLGDPAAFWPAPVARLIAAHQAGLHDRPDGTDGGAGGTDGGAGGPYTLPSVTPPTVAQVPEDSWATPPLDRPEPPTPEPGDRTGPPAGPAGPPMGRRRALAAVAGMATGGLAVAAWKLTRPGQPSASAGTVARPTQRPGTKAWSFTASGPVQAIAVSGRTVFAGTATSKVYALDAVTGKPLWQRSTTREFNDKMAATGQAVYIADATDGGAYALDAATGRQLWSVPTQGGPLDLVVTGGVVYLGGPAKSNTTGGVSALSAVSGGLLWSAEFGPVSDVTGGLAVEGGTVYATSSDGELFAYDATSGNKRWRIAGKNIAFGSPPVVANGVVYVGGVAAGDGDSKASALYAVRAATHRQLWQYPTGVSQFPPDLAVAGGVVFAAFTRSNEPSGPGDLNAVNAATGKPRWKVRVAGGAYPAPVVAAGVVYSGSNNGVLTARQAGTGRELWGFSAAGGIGTHVLMAGGLLYFGAGTQVYAVAAQ